MKALSIRQPWAWLILNGGKDIENRTWATNVRGRVLIHAATGCTRAEHHAAIAFAHERCGIPLERMTGANFDRLLRGGIVGSVEITGCTREARSPWFIGPNGFQMRDPRPSPFIPFRGRLGFFDVPDLLIPESMR